MNVPTTNVEINKVATNNKKIKKKIKRESTLLSILSRSIEPTQDSKSQDRSSIYSDISDLNPTIAEFIVSEKTHPKCLDFRRESYADFRDLDIKDDDVDSGFNLGGDSVSGRSSAFEHLTKMANINRRSSSINSKLCNII